MEKTGLISVRKSLWRRWKFDTKGTQIFLFRSLLYSITGRCGFPYIPSPVRNVPLSCSKASINNYFITQTHGSNLYCHRIGGRSWGRNSFIRNEIEKRFGEEKRAGLERGRGKIRDFEKGKKPYINVSADQINFTPISLKEIETKIMDSIMEKST